MMTRLAMAVLVLLAAPATAQVTSLEAANQPVKIVGDPNRIVCERQESTGTRLGARKVCLTVAEWAEKKREHRETLESIQHFGTSVGCQEGQSCQ